MTKLENKSKPITKIIKIAMAVCELLKGKTLLIGLNKTVPDDVLFQLARDNVRVE